MHEKRNLDDLAAELDGLSALLCVLSSGFLENEVTETNATIGNALFGLEYYAARLADDLQSIVDEQAKGARKK